MTTSEYKPKYFKAIPSRNPNNIISEAIKNREVPMILDTDNLPMKCIFMIPHYNFPNRIGKTKKGELVNMGQFFLTAQAQGHRFEVRKEENDIVFLPDNSSDAPKFDFVWNHKKTDEEILKQSLEWAMDIFTEDMNPHMVAKFLKDKDDDQWYTFQGEYSGNGVLNIRMMKEYFFFTEDLDTFDFDRVSQYSDWEDFGQ